MTRLKQFPWPIMALTLAGFAIATSEFVMMGLLVDIANSLHITISQSGLLISAYALGVVIGGPVVALLTTRVPLKLSLIGMMGVFVCGSAFCALSSHYYFLLLARILTASCHGTFFGIASVVATRLVVPSKRTLAVALVFLGTTLANMIGVPAGTALGFAFGWRSTFWMVSMIGLLSVAGLILFLPQLSSTASSNALNEFKTLKKPSVQIPLALSALTNGGLFVVLTYITPLLLNITKVPQSHITYILLILGIGLPIGTLLGGKLGDKALLKSLFTLYPLLLILLILMPLAIRNEISGVMVLFFWNMITFTIAPMLQVMVVNNAYEAPNLASTFNQSAFNLGNAVGAWSGSWLLASHFSYNQLPFVSVIYILVALGLVFLYHRLQYGKIQTSLQNKDPF